MSSQIEFTEENFYKEGSLPWVRLTDPDQSHDIKCPACEAIYDYPVLEDLTGKQFRCENCGHTSVVRSTKSYLVD